MPAATWAISRSSGPRTAATMQNSVAPVLAVCLAASTRLGMSSQALRTGEENRPDCEQKWQSSGQPPVFRLMMPSTSTSGPHQRMRTSWASASRSSRRSSGSCRTSSTCSLRQAFAALEHLLAGRCQHVHGCLRHRRSSYRSSNLNTVQARVLRQERSDPGRGVAVVQLHKRDVVAKAASILDSYGIADLTMRRLARELDVTPGALYWHFANKQELLGAVADQVLAPACADPAPDRLARAHRGRLPRPARRLLSHTDGAELVSASFAAGQSRAVEHDSRCAGRGGRRGRRRRRPPGSGRPHGAALRARRHGRRAVTAAVGRGRR